MNKIRKRIIYLLIFVSFALMANQCADIVAAILATPAATQDATQLSATQIADTTQIAATRIAFVATEMAADRQTATARPTEPPSPVPPTSTLDISGLRTRLAVIQTEAAKLTGPPTPQSITTTVPIGEVFKTDTFNVSVTKAVYVAPNPNGAFFITVSLENKTSTDLPYSIDNFSVTSSAGEHKVLVLPKPQGSTWSDDFLPNSSVPANDKATLRFLAELSGPEKDFWLRVSLGDFTPLIYLSLVVRQV